MELNKVLKREKVSPQSISVDGNWVLTYNTLTNIDPDSHSFSSNEVEKVWIWMFTQDLVQIQCTEAGQLLDIGWSPEGDPEGQFVLQLIGQDTEGEWDWEKKISLYKTRSLPALLQEIKRITH